MTIVEIQGTSDACIYERVVIEMAMVQRQNGVRKVQGIIPVLDESLAPKTQPWTKIVRSISLRESIEQVERTAPHHPLVAVFRPLLTEREEDLERQAATCYSSIVRSELSETAAHSGSQHL